MNKIEKIIEEDGFYVSTSSGTSMYPLLRNRKDTIIIRKKNTRYKKYDIVLYKRNGKYILHRIIKVLECGYIIRGDNCYWKEYDINDSKIIGYLDECYRGEKKVNLNGLPYKLYVNLWTMCYPLRHILFVARKRFSLLISSK